MANARRQWNDSRFTGTSDVITKISYVDIHLNSFNLRKLSRTFIKRLINYKNLKLKKTLTKWIKTKKLLASLQKLKRHTLISWTNTGTLMLLQLMTVGTMLSASSFSILNLFRWCFLKAGSMADTKRRHSSTTVSSWKMDKKPSTRNSLASYAISYCKNGQPSTREQKNCASMIFRTLRLRLHAIASSTTSSNSKARTNSELTRKDWWLHSISVGHWRSMLTLLKIGRKTESSQSIATYFCLLGE